jgi:hypothetical protein
VRGWAHWTDVWKRSSERLGGEVETTNQGKSDLGKSQMVIVLSQNSELTLNPVSGYLIRFILD